jgi:TorA maturation chaperone TorD
MTATQGTTAPLSAEEFETVLAARQYLYVLYENILGNEPTVEQLQAIDAGAAREALALVRAAAGVGDEDDELASMPFLDDLEGRVQALDQARSDYTRLFLGPGKVPVPPWESVYATKSRVLFTEETLQVRETYRANGYLPADYPHVADDHLALELDFMAHLAGEALEAGPDDRLAYLHTSKQFLNDHLLKWAPSYAADMQAQSREHFYAAVAQSLAGFLQLDRLFLQEHSS